MSAQRPRKMYTLVQLLMEVGSIILKIKEKSKSDPSLPKEPLNLVREALTQSQNEKELRANLKRALISKQEINTNALIDYVSTLAKVQNERPNREDFEGGFSGVFVKNQQSKK